MGHLDKIKRLCYNESNPSSRGASRLSNDKKSGFTMVEVMIVLALSGMLLAGILGSAFSSIAAQRYNDAVRSFAEYLRTIYSEVANPESLGAGNSTKYAVYGKVIVVGDAAGPSKPSKKVHSATIVGDADIPSNFSGNLTDELEKVHVKVYCGQDLGFTTATSETTVNDYTMLWESSLQDAKKPSQPFRGTIIIFRSPASGSIHTLYAEGLFYDLNEDCSEGGGLQQFIANNLSSFKAEDVGFCIKSEDSNVMREVRIAADGRNSSAVSVLNTDVTGSDDGAGGSRCQ